MEKECLHKWKYSGFSWCQECSEFIDSKNHGYPTFICLKCGLLCNLPNGKLINTPLKRHDEFLGYFNKEEINNFISMNQFYPKFYKKEIKNEVK